MFAAGAGTATPVPAAGSDPASSLRMTVPVAPVPVARLDGVNLAYELPENNVIVSFP
jgi:hypothetical protein